MDVPEDIRDQAERIAKQIDGRVEDATIVATMGRLLSLSEFAAHLISEALLSERLAQKERDAKICDKEVAAMERVADFHRPPRVDYDPELAEMHDQGAAVAFKLAAAIRQS